MSDFTTPKKKKRTGFVSIVVYAVALLGALGVAFQNFSAFSDMLVTGLHLSTTQAFAFSIVAAGVCTTVVNFCLNANLLHNFYKRITKKPLPALSTVAKIQYGLGTLVFIITGILFGLTAFSVAGAGGLSALGWSAILAITVGVFVSVITIFQELETWLESFDNLIAIEIYKKWQKLEKDTDNVLEGTNVANRLLEKLKKLVFEEQPLTTKNQEIINELELFIKTNNTKQNLIEKLKALQAQAEAVQLNESLFYKLEKWLEKLNPARFIGFIISLGNVMALSLLFTIGLTIFLTHVGVAALPALIIGFSVAFTAGAFTEFYFYQGFLTNFCDKIEERWTDLFKSKNWGMGILTVVVNGGINGVLAYFGVQVLETLFLNAGIVVPALLPLAIVSAVFAGAASLLLGTDFWISNAEKFAALFGIKTKHLEEDVKPLLGGDSQKNNNTNYIATGSSPFSKNGDDLARHYGPAVTPQPS